MEELVGPLDQAIYSTVHEYVDPVSGRRGAAALAPKLGVQPGSLSNKANITQEHTQLGLRESIPLQVTAGDYRILHAYASALGHCAYVLPRTSCSDIELLDQYAEFHQRIGDKAAAIRRALSDRRITATEAREIRALLDPMIRAALQLVARFEVLAHDR